MQSNSPDHLVNPESHCLLGSACGVYANGTTARKHKKLN